VQEVVVLALVFPKVRTVLVTVVVTVLVVVDPGASGPQADKGA
jgi:hypothetical protein